MKIIVNLSTILLCGLALTYLLLSHSCIKKCGTPPDLKSLSVSENILQEFPYHKDSSMAITLIDAIEEYPPLTLTCENKRRECYHEWKCPNDNSVKEIYWESVEENHFRLIASWIEFDIYIFPQRNGENLNNYHQKFTVDIREAETTCCVFQFVLDNESDLSANNDNLEYYDEISLNNKTFYNVYSNRLTEDDKHKIYFTKKEGIVGFYRKSDDRTYCLK